MAVERGYQQQVGARAQDVAVQTNPDAYGAGVGRAIGELGQTMHRADLQAYQIERRARADSEASDFARRFAEWRVTMDETVRKARSSAASGGAGHEEAIRNAYDKGRDALFSGITEDSVRRQAEQQFSSFGASLLEREGTWQEGRRVAKVLDDAQVLSDIGANRVRQAVDQGAYLDEVKAGYAYVDSLNLDADSKAKLRRELVDQKYAISFLNGLNDRDPVTAKGLIDAGAFNDVLEPGQIEQLRNGADVEIRRSEAQAQHEATMQKAALTEQIQTMKEMDQQGIEIPADQLKAARDAAAAIGDTSVAAELDGMMANNAYARVYRGQTPVQREARLAELAGKDRPSATEQRELQWLRQHSGALDSEFNNDPVGYAAKYGAGSSVPPPIDPADPQSIGKRLEWRRQYSRATGRPVPVFSDNEIVPLRERVASGAAGRLEVLRALDVMPSADRALAAQQIVPNDVGFRHEALIQPFARATVYAGREKLAADRGFLSPDKKSREGQRAQQLLNIAGSEIDFALRAMQPAEAAAVKEIAGQWLAGWLSAKGRDVNSLTPGDIRNAATAAFGGQSKNGTYLGGIGHWAGGQAYVVPDGFSHTGFQNYATRQRLADDKAGAGPVDEDGQPLRPQQGLPGAGRQWPLSLGNPRRIRRAQQEPTGIHDAPGSRAVSVVAAMQPRLDQDRTMPQRAATSQEGAADPGFIDSLTASFRSARDDQPTHMNEERINAYGEVAQALVDRGYDFNQYWNTQTRGYGDTVNFGQVWRDVEVERRKDPKAFATLPKTQAEFEAQWQAKMRIRMERDAATVARSGWMPWLLGGLGAGLTDPINLGAMVLSGGTSSILQTAAREAGINVGIEALELPMINMERAKQGRPQMDAGEAVTTLAMAGLVGAAFGGASKGIEVGSKAAFEKLVPLDVRAAWALDEAIPRYSRTPDLNAAINVARADAETRFGSPFVPTYEGFDAHFARLNDTLAKLENGVKVDVIPAVARAIAGDAGEAIDRYMASARGQESGGNDAARSATSSAAGRYGFIDSTWVAYYRKAFPNTGLSDDRILARKTDGQAQDRVMRAFTEDNAAWLQRNNIEATPGNLYVVHHMGPGGAERIFSAAPDTSLAAILPAEVMAANPHLRGMTAGEFRAWADRKMGGGGALPVAEEMPIVRPAALDAERPTIDQPSPIAATDIVAPETPALRPDMVNEGIYTAMRAVVDDRNISLNDIPGLVRELATDEETLQPILQKLVDEGRLTLTKSGIYRRKMARGPEDALTFIARRGGLSYDGLDPALRDKVGTSGHDLKNSGNLDYFVPQSGPLLRPTGQGLDRMAELLWDAGYFGPPATTPRPSETDLITWLDDAIRKKEKRYSFADQAPAAKTTAADFTAPKEDGGDVAAQAALDRQWARYDRWNEAASAAGTAPLGKPEIARLEAMLADGTDTLPPVRGEDLPSPEELAPYVLEMVNREIDDVLEAAYLEVEDALYDPANYGNEGQAGGAAEGSGGQAPDAGIARPGEAGAGAGASPSQLDEIEAAGLGPALVDEKAHAAFDDPAGAGVQQVADSAWHDVRAGIDPNIAERQRQQAQLGAEAPMRALTEQDGTMGLGLFDAADQPTFDLGDGKGARTIQEIEAEIAADEAAIDAIKGCLL